MKIISNRKDYYDGVGMGIDDSDHVFVRKLEILTVDTETKDHPLSFSLRLCKLARDDYVKKLRDKTFSCPFFEFLMLHFCGKVYPIYIHGYRNITVDVDVKQSDIRTPDMVIHMASDAEGFEKLIEFNGDIYHKPGGRKQGVFYYIMVENEFHKAVMEIFGTSAKPSLMNAKYNSPVVVEKYKGRGVLEHRVNDNMAMYGLAKLFPPQQAYQEISMWFGTHYQRGEREMAAVSDKDRVQQHGFDGMSFRKSPTKRK